MYVRVHRAVGEGGRMLGRLHLILGIALPALPRAMCHHSHSGGGRCAAHAVRQYDRQYARPMFACPSIIVLGRSEIWECAGGDEGGWRTIVHVNVVRVWKSDKSLSNGRIGVEWGQDAATRDGSVCNVNVHRYTSYTSCNTIIIMRTWYSTSWCVLSLLSISNCFLPTSARSRTSRASRSRVH